MELQLQSKFFLSKKFLLQPNFETRSRLHIYLYIMGHTFSMYTVTNISTEILSNSRATQIYWMENNPDGQLLKVLVFLFLYLESKQVIILWKVSKRIGKTRKLIFSLSSLALLELYLHLQTIIVIFSRYRYLMKKTSTL